MAKQKKVEKQSSKASVGEPEGASAGRRGRKSAVKAAKEGAPRRRRQDDDGDDLPPDDLEEADAVALDTESLAAEVELTEAKASEETGDEAAAPLPVAAADGDGVDAADADTILPSMEGMSILRETELNDVIQDVKRRSEANGGYITYE